MKPIKQWFEELPEPYRTQALENTPKIAEEKEVESVADAVVYGFTWFKTSQGYDYWQQPHMSL